MRSSRSTSSRTRRSSTWPKSCARQMQPRECGVPRVRGSRRWPSGSGRMRKTISRTCDSSSPRTTRSTRTANSRSRGKPSWSTRLDEPPVTGLHRASRACKGCGFDHAAVHHGSSRLYVAHTSNDDVDVVDSSSDRFLESIHGLKGVAGVLVSDERDLLFTANRGENTISIFVAGREQQTARLSVGIRPNGLAFDPSLGLLLVANVGDSNVPNSSSVSLVDAGQKTVTGTLVLPGRPRWPVYDEVTGAFYVNIADPPLIVGIDANHPSEIRETFEIPSKGPHGLDLDPRARQLFCACDEGKLVTVHLDTGEVRLIGDLSGPPDVVFFNRELRRLYDAVGFPGVVDVFDAGRMRIIEAVSTEKGAHTLAFDTRKNKVYVFLPATHRAAVYQDD